MLRKTILIYLSIVLWIAAADAANIKGKLILDESWSPIVYFSVIHDFDDLHTASYDFLRYQTDLDSTGYFEFKDLELIEGDLIYRLHVCKKGDPVSIILIGGQEENFIHFIMNNQSDISLVENENVLGLSNYKVSGDPSGNSLSRLFNL